MSRIWTGVTDSISNDDNRWAKRASLKIWTAKMAVNCTSEFEYNSVSYAYGFEIQLRKA